MPYQTPLIEVGRTAVFPPGAGIVAVTLGPDSLVDACEVEGTLLTACGIVRMPAPAITVPTQRARTHGHKHQSPGALVSLVGYTADEIPTPQPRVRFRRKYTVLVAPLEPGYDEDGLIGIVPAYGRRNLRVALSSDGGVVRILALMVSYVGGSQGAEGDGFGFVVDMAELTVDEDTTTPAGYQFTSVGFGTSVTLGVSTGAPPVRTAITRGGDGAADLACDEVWLVSGSANSGSLIVEVW